MRNLLYVLIVLVLSGCKKENIQFRYFEKEDPFLCSTADMDMVKEALYVFEDYISQNYGFLTKDIEEGYENYIKLLVDDRAPASEYFNEHLIALKSFLKDKDELWVLRDGQLRLNYDQELVSCIVDNIQDEELRQNIDALISSNTIRADLMGPVLFRKRKQFVTDKALASFVVFEFFYPKLFYMDSPDYVENVDRPKPKEKLFPEKVEN